MNFVIFVSCTYSKVTENEIKSIDPEKPEFLKSVTEKIFDKLISDGFDFPVGNANGGGSYMSVSDKVKYDGWYVSVKTAESYEMGLHTGEDWNGSGGGNTDFGQPVYSISKGLIIEAKDFGAPWGKVVVIEHRYIENAEVKTVFSLYAHLNEFFVSTGDTVLRRDTIATIGNADGNFYAHLHFEIRKSGMSQYNTDYWPSSDGKDAKWILENYEKPSEFIKNHRNLFVPANSEDLLVVIKSEYIMHHYKAGVIEKTYEIGLSQNPLGHKQERGDNRLPEGEYFIVEKSRGPFGGDFSAYFGPAWMRINYPNKYDAEAAFENGVISESEKNEIKRLFEKKLATPKNTALGGGIGIHGWAYEWELSGNRDLTWGCITMLNHEIDTFYDKIPVGCRILIYP
ncbi:MAG: hypothetical protein A2281_00960 [Bacteroidetes bacterium RIFOXYA12_FULL_38_20]|nr:MAG: hypothetical protein A2281_00960 [Bacteroidetes bacterium RIFOXYA12_FULL_38_20]